MRRADGSASGARGWPARPSGQKPPRSRRRGSRLALLLLVLAAVGRRLGGSREARAHERFGQAVEQLASERADGSRRTETRLGGIYALERLAAESDEQYWPVMEVLTAYVRENAVRSLAAAPEGSAQVRPGADVQA